MAKVNTVSNVWTSQDVPPQLHIGWVEWLRVIARAVPLIILVFGGLIVLLLVRLFERPICGVGRPVTPYNAICLSWCVYPAWYPFRKCRFANEEWGRRCCEPRVVA